MSLVNSVVSVAAHVAVSLATHRFSTDCETSWRSRSNTMVQRGYTTYIFYYVVKAIADRNTDRARARRLQTATMSIGEILRQHVRQIDRN